MSLLFVHLSDIHIRTDNPEGHGVVVDALFEDLRVQLRDVHSRTIYVVISGDVAQAATGDQYREVLRTFRPRLDALGISKARTIVVPGNHDVERPKVEAQMDAHEDLICGFSSEATINAYLNNGGGILQEKFAAYRAFEKEFAAYGTGPSSTGAGWLLPEGVGVYCLNTAICSSAGAKQGDRKYPDKGRLAFDSKGLHKWLQECAAPKRMLVMHHPLDWLCDWAQAELKALQGRQFFLVLSGHTHDQRNYQTIHADRLLVECSAPPLYTRKTDPLGYSLISVDPNGNGSIKYRQWTRYHTFVAGTAFSDNDTGVVEFSGMSVSSEDADRRRVEKALRERRHRALKAFAAQPVLWVPPIVSTAPEVERDSDSRPKLDIEKLLVSTNSLVVHAPTLFGKTCLAHHLVLEAWVKRNERWAYINASSVKSNRAAIEDAIKADFEATDSNPELLRCIVVDSLSSNEKEGFKLLRKLCELYPEARIVCMQTNESGTVSRLGSEFEVGRSFQHVYLWSMSRSQIRQAVAEYVDAKPIGDEETLTRRLVSDLDGMNVHRTPMNCFTLLKVCEVEFDESPVNRTEMIKRVLHVLFNVDSLPTYKSRPDLKDCEYVLGHFCEQIVRTGQQVFTRERFLSTTQEYCRSRVIELDTAVVFDVLYENAILTRSGSGFCFRFTYWVYYFLAQRMHHDATFANYIFEDQRYSRFPEVIEFYTGIDRRRGDALTILIADVGKNCNSFEQRLNLPAKLDIFGSAQWKPSPEALANMQAEVSTGLQESNLPTSVKDSYADRSYDRAKPYNQEIRSILDDQSYARMLQSMRAGARGLRNSDHADPDLKRALLREVLRVWEQSALVLLILLPVLAERGEANFEGVSYILGDDFGDSLQARFHNVLGEIPANISYFYQDDLFSHKMGPLLIEQFGAEQSSLRTHLLALLLVRQRPKGWKAVIQSYIAKIPKNSFYLLDLYRCLRGQYRYSYASSSMLRDMEFLIRMAVTKHVTGAKDPGIKIIEKFKDKIEGDAVIPPRSEDM